MPEWKKHGLFGDTDSDDPEGVSIGMCKKCGKMGMGMELGGASGDVCKRCRYEASGSTKPFKFWRDNL